MTLVDEDHARAATLDPSTLDEFNGKLCGVYMILEGEEITYIGRSKDICRRIKWHMYSSTGFSSVRFIEVQKDELVKAELGLIRKYCPRYNRAGVPKAKQSAPLDGPWKAASECLYRERYEEHKASKEKYRIAAQERMRLADEERVRKRLEEKQLRKQTAEAIFQRLTLDERGLLERYFEDRMLDGFKAILYPVDLEKLPSSARQGVTL